jgi:hypothetical protein
MNSPDGHEAIAKRQALISVAMLKVSFDERSIDYLEYLMPFVLEALRDFQDHDIVAHDVSQKIRAKFSIVVPQSTVELCLRRLAGKKLLKREFGRFWISGSLPAPNFQQAKEHASAQITNVLGALCTFAKKQYEMEWGEDVALDAVYSYLNRFGIECLSTFVQRSILPPITGGGDNKPHFIVNSFILHISQTAGPAWDAMYVLVRAYMFSNALLCPDLESLAKSFGFLTVYLDTRVILRLLGLEGAEHQAATTEMVELVSKLSAKISVFSHTIAEIDSVIVYCQHNLNKPLEYVGSVILHARKMRMTETDFALIRIQLKERLGKFGISVSPTPSYTPKFQIDEAILGDSLEGEIGVIKEKVKEHDINSIRSIYVLRQGTAATRLEDVKAVFVTTNAPLARATYQYGKQFESSREVSAAITAHSLSNISWLKRPVDATDLPKREMLSVAFAAMQPTEGLWEKFVLEVNKLRANGLIDSRTHSLLRYDLRVRYELMELTLGSDQALGPATVTAVVKRVEDEIRKEEVEKLRGEKEAHAGTLAKLTAHEAHVKSIISAVGRIAGWVVFAMIVLLVSTGAILATYFLAEVIKLSWPLKFASILLTLMFLAFSILGLAFGFTFHSVRLSTQSAVSNLTRKILWRGDQ